MEILIADDSRPIRELIKSLLSRGNHTFIECEDGIEAVDCYTRHHTDIVLMDISMKRMNGLESSEKIISAYPDAKIIVVTQYDEPELREKAKNIGVRDYITKDNLLKILEYIQKIKASEVIS